ncbi:triose-phosphate isomerase [Candidatus Kaiserbacteria bacterium]|nr:MAG: triose-phosphate isomerase [Candidatus Kaiserbacteria bacterium]
MKKGILPLVVGNWKMNPQSISLGAKLATELKKKLQSVKDVEIVIAPSYVHLSGVQKVRSGSDIFALGAQNVHPAKLGPHTGEISLPLLQDLGVSHVILGHSERRALGEKDPLINEKLVAVIKAGLTGILCVGEGHRDHSGHYLNTIETQVRKGLALLSKAKLGQVVIAYEPLWAIGSGKNATAEDIHEMKLFIEKILSDLYGRNIAQKVRIIYGGSVTAQNAQALHADGMMDGFLVGGASLHPDEFTHIAKAVRTM